MKTLYCLALVGFVLALGSAIPLSEERAEALDNTELKEIANDFPEEDKASDAGLEDEQNEDMNVSDEDEEDEDLAEDEEDDEDDDSDDEDEGDKNGRSLSSSVKKSSDPIIGAIFRPRRVFRGVRRVVRRFRRRRRRGGSRRGGWRWRRRRFRG